jgi:cytochrome P450
MRDTPNTLLNIADRYGDVAMIRLGFLKLVVLNHPRYVKEVLVTRNRDFIKGGAFFLMRSVLGEGLLTSDGDFHLRQRRMVQPAFSADRIAQYAQQMSDCARRVRDSWQDGATIEIFREMSHTSLTIATETLFGVGIENRTDEVRQALTEVLRNWKFGFLPLANLLHRFRIPFPSGLRLRRARARLDAILYDVIAQKRRTGESGSDLLSMLVHHVDEGERMTDRQLRDEAMTLMLAGHETTATALTWMWYLLAQHPEVSRRFYAEIDEVLGDREPTFQDLPKLPYTRQVFAETLRLYPPVWIFTRRALCDVPLGPYVLPRGCQVMACPWVVHRNPQFFPDPLRFDPDRWTPQMQKTLPDMAYFPFSGGVRRCIGERFAWVEAALVAATLAQRWQMEVLPGQNVVPARAFICRPRDGIRMRLIRRRAPVAAPCATTLVG